MTEKSLFPGRFCLCVSEVVLTILLLIDVLSISIRANDMPMDESNLVCFGLAAAFKAAGKPVPFLKYHLANHIPYCRGLGSSSAAIVGGLVAGLVLAGHQVPAWCVLLFSC